MVQAWGGSQAYAYNTYAVASKIMAGGKIGAEASLNKIFWSELDRAMHRTAMQLLGARNRPLHSLDRRRENQLRPEPAAGG